MLDVRGWSGVVVCFFFFFVFFNDTATTEIYTLSLHDALPISEHPAVIYGEGAGAELDILRTELAEKAKFFWMAPGTNSRGALAAGLGGEFNPELAKCIYILACESEGPSGHLLEQIKGADFVVVQTSYMEPWSGFADVILPSVNWAEKDGTVTNMEGRILNMAKAVRPLEGVRGELEILEALMDKLGYSTLETDFAADD